MKEAVGLFTDVESLQEAVKELEATDFPRDAISVIGPRERIEEKFGISAISPDLADLSPETPRSAPPRSEEKVIGAGALVTGSAYIGAMGVALAAGAVTIPGIIAAAAIGGIGGATAGGIVAKILGDHFNKDIEDQIEKGGMLLWVRTPDPAREEKACTVLEKYGARHIRLHEMRNVG